MGKMHQKLFGVLVLALFLSPAINAAEPAAIASVSTTFIVPSPASQPSDLASEAQIAQNIARGLPAGYTAGDTTVVSGSSSTQMAASVAAPQIAQASTVTAPKPGAAPIVATAPEASTAQTPAPNATPTTTASSDSFIIPSPASQSSGTASQAQISQNIARGLPAGYTAGDTTNGS